MHGRRTSGDGLRQDRTVEHTTGDDRPVGRTRRLLGAVGVRRGAVLLVAAGGAAALVVDAARTGPLEPRDPSTPAVGVLAGTVADTPDGRQDSVTLRFSQGAVAREVLVRQGGAFSLELPPGDWTVTDGSGRGVCPSQVVVHAAAWQRSDLLWPCTSDGPLGGGSRPPPPPAVPPALAPA